MKNLWLFFGIYFCACFPSTIFALDLSGVWEGAGESYEVLVDGSLGKAGAKCEKITMDFTQDEKRLRVNEQTFEFGKTVFSEEKWVDYEIKNGEILYEGVKIGQIDADRVKFSQKRFVEIENEKPVEVLLVHEFTRLRNGNLGYKLRKTILAPLFKRISGLLQAELKKK